MSARRRNIMLGTAGHVDHGKTALVKLLTGCETDTLAEEKQRGLTIDLGFAPCRLADDRVVGVVDVPGHVDFIRNMVAGAHGIDVVILVVAADDGVMPQTREHLHILTLMGLRHGLVALSKIDLVDRDRRETVAAGLRQLLAGTFLEQAPLCPISSLTGEGYDGFFDTLNAVVGACEDRPCTGLFRVWVADVFPIRGAGTVLTGIPSGGVVRPGASLQLLPGGREGRVRRLQVYGQDAEEGRAGECVALNIPELDPQTVRRGLVLCESDALEPVTMAEAELQALAALRKPLLDNLEAQLHLGTASLPARVALLESRHLAPGQSQMVQLRFQEPLALAPGERFVLRANLAGANWSGLTTIGGGRVLGVSNVRLRRRRPWVLAALAARRAALGEPARWMECLLCEQAGPMTPLELQRRCLLRPEEAAAWIAHLRSTGRLCETPGGALVHPELVRQTADRILGVVQTFHLEHTSHAGLVRDQLQSAVGGHAEVFDTAVATLLQAQRLECHGTVLAQAGWSARLSDQDQQFCAQLAEACRSAGWSSPTVPELAVTLRTTPERIDAAARLLVERGVLVRLEERLLLHRDALEAAKQVVLDLFAQAPSFTTMAFRDALGVSRKFAVPLLDHLDRLRFTVRSGHVRTPGAEARKLLR